MKKQEVAVSKEAPVANVKTEDFIKAQVDPAAKTSQTPKARTGNKKDIQISQLQDEDVQNEKVDKSISEKIKGGESQIVSSELEKVIEEPKEEDKEQEKETTNPKTDDFIDAQIDPKNEAKQPETQPEEHKGKLLIRMTVNVNVSSLKIYSVVFGIISKLTLF